MTTSESKQQLEQIAQLRTDGLMQGWPIPQIVAAIVERFGVSRLEAHRLARGWTRRRAVEEILKTYDADGLARPSLTPQRLCAWEHDPRIRSGEDYLDRLCRVYQTRPDLLGYGHDYTPAPDAARNGAAAAYAGTPPASPAVVVDEHDAGHGMQAHGEETSTDRTEFLQGVGAAGLTELLERASNAAVWLDRKLGSSNLGPATLEHLQLRIVDLVHAANQAPPSRLFPTVFAQLKEVGALLDGAQPLRQRRGLYRIAGQLSFLLGRLSHDLGDYPGARAHLLTAWHLGEQVGDYALRYRVRVTQSTVAFWAGDLRGALDYAQDGQRYAAPGQHAQLAARCEGRVYARKGDRGEVINALQRAQATMLGQPASAPDGWWIFTPGDLQLYTGMSLLWLGNAADAEPHARQSIAWHESAPPALRSPSTHAQAQINLAICLADQNQPDEGIQLVTDALQVGREHDYNLQQASEFLTALKPAHRKLPAARDLAEQLQTIRATRPTLNIG